MRMTSGSWATNMEAQPKRRNLEFISCPCGKREMLVHKRVAALGCRLLPCGGKGCGS